MRARETPHRLGAVGEPSEERGPSAPPRTLADWVREYQTIALTLLAAVVYADLRLSYYFFYSRMGVSPEEVGLSYFGVLANSAVGFAVMILAIGLLIWIYGIVQYWFIERFIERSAGQRRAAARRVEPAREKLIACLIAFESLSDDEISAAPISGLIRTDKGVQLRRRSFRLAWKTKLSTETIAALEAFDAIRRGNDRLIGDDPIWDRERIRAVRSALDVAAMKLDPEPLVVSAERASRSGALLRSALFCVVAALMLVAFYWIPHTAGSMADRPIRGEGVGPVTLGNLAFFSLVAHGQVGNVPVLAVRAQPATISWTGTAPTGYPDEIACLMYLGQADGVTVLFDWRNGQPLRVPTNSVAVKFLPASPKECGARA
jgi:hypothetical protein